MGKGITAFASALVLSLVLGLAGIANAKIGNQGTVTGQGDAMIKFSGVVLNIDGNHAEAEIRFVGTTFGGDTIIGEGFIRFPARISDGHTLAFDWDVSGEGYTVFTANLDGATHTDKLMEGRGRVEFTGEILKIINPETGDVHYQFDGDGRMSWNGDFW